MATLNPKQEQFFWAPEAGGALPNGSDPTVVDAARAAGPEINWSLKGSL